jgi:hypothetical protein
MIVMGVKICEYNGCKTQPTFGYHGGAALYCDGHKEDDMIDVVNKLCEREGCRTQPSYGIKGEKPRFCIDHKEENMVNVISKLCEQEGCPKQPSYGFAGKAIRFCESHKADGMVSDQSKNCRHDGCPTRASYGKLFGKKEYCAKHKSVNMYIASKINPKCSDCNGKALYCSADNKYPQRCEEHKLDDDENVIEKPCVVCGLSYFILSNEDKCNSCSDYEDPTIRHAKELRIKDVLETHNIKYKSHDTIPDFACSRYRPDYIIECPMFSIVVEVDENQHKSYACECEIGRMVQLHQDFGGTPVVFIRYNPDNYKDHLGKLDRGKNQNITREKSLVGLVKRLLDKSEMPPLSVYYMYYDGYDGNPTQFEIDYFNNTIESIVDKK